MTPQLPRYRIPLRRLIQAAYYMALNRPRDLGKDFRFLMPHMPIAPVIRGVENLPRSGPFVLVANHYERPGLWMGWSGMLVSRVAYEHTGRRLRWIAVAEWRDYKLAGFPIPPGVTRFLFARFFDTFGFIAMEPEGSSAHDRAGGVRSAMNAIKAGDPIGIFPEGNIGETSAMIQAQPGSGTFLIALSQRATIIPTGLYERNGRLQVAFGQPVDLTGERRLSRNQRDTSARYQVMTAVARLLPSSLQGEYRT